MLIDVISLTKKHLQITKTRFIMRLFLFATQFTAIKFTIFELHGRPAGR